MVGITLAGFDTNFRTQVGLVVLVGLAAKNAILIVEFAKQAEDAGDSVVDAVVKACRLRLRPILMTAFAFILGVVPMALATGPGAEMRQALGVTVFSGMLGVTFFGLFLTPVFYVTIRSITRRLRPLRRAAEVQRSEEHTSELQSLMRKSYAVLCLKKNRKLETVIKSK